MSAVTNLPLQFTKAKGLRNNIAKCAEVCKLGLLKD